MRRGIRIALAELALPDTAPQVVPPALQHAQALGKAREFDPELRQLVADQARGQSRPREVLRPLALVHELRHAATTSKEIRNALLPRYLEASSGPFIQSPRSL